MDEQKNNIIDLVLSLDDEGQVENLYIMIKSFLEELRNKAVS